MLAKDELTITVKTLKNRRRTLMDPAKYACLFKGILSRNMEKTTVDPVEQRRSRYHPQVEEPIQNSVEFSGK